MSGQVVSGVQQRIKEVHPYVAYIYIYIYIYCMAHKLNLVLVECCAVNRTVKTQFLNVLDKLYAVFAEPSNHHRFIESPEH